MQLFFRFLPIILVIGTIISSAENQWKHIGNNFTLKETIPIVELENQSEKYFNQAVKIEGIIASVCTKEGCIIEVVSKDGAGEGVIVNFPEQVHRFPTDCAGYEVIVEGMFYQKIYPESRVRYWQVHSFRKGKKVPEFSLIKQIQVRLWRRMSNAEY